MPAAPAPPARSRPVLAERAIVGINASYLTASRAFDDTRTFDLYAEQGSFTADYDVEARLGLDAGAFVRVWHGLAVGVVFTTHKDDSDLVIEGSVPHPLLFNQPRSIEGTVPDARGNRRPPAGRLHRARQPEAARGRVRRPELLHGEAVGCSPAIDL